VSFVASCNESTSPPSDANDIKEQIQDKIEEEIAQDTINEIIHEIPEGDLFEEFDVQQEPALDNIDVSDAPTDQPGCEEGCGAGALCCNGRCVNPAYDPEHCGGCNNPCPNETPFCDGGTCTETPCEGVVCQGGTYCCGSNCCNIGQVCCIVQRAGPASPPECHDDFCPVGCPACL